MNPTKIRRPRALAAGVLIAALLAACGSSGGDVGTSDRVSVAIRTFRFRPTTVAVDVGSSVRWTNEDRILHTVTSGRPRRQGIPGVSEDRPAVPDGAFDHDLDGAGSTATVTFDAAGTYTYYCDIHAGMVGRIVVR